jgi:serine/threonine-protein kinase
MDAELLARLLDEALVVQPNERAAFLRDSCGEDLDLLRALETLLASHEDSDFLQHPLLQPQPDAVAGMDLLAHVTPQRLGPYEILARIGEGGMSSVFVARRDDGEPPAGEVAIKLIRLDLLGAEERFSREKGILERLDHPSLVKLHETGLSADRRPYFVMEHVDGLPITDHCDVRGLAIDERLALFLEVCEAVHYSHQNLVVHRDLKPSNILVDADGRPRLLDFGIAKWLEEDGQRAPVTVSPAPVLTPSYAAPELVARDPITTVTDVYSLGVLLFELLTGFLPRDWRGHSQVEILKRWRWEEPAPPSRIVAEADRRTASEIARQRSTRRAALARRLQGDLDNIVLRALRFEPRRRYQSVPALAADIRRHLHGLPVEARPATRRYRLAKLVRRHAVAVANVALVFALLAAAAIHSALVAGRVSRERDAAERERTIADDERRRADEAMRFLVDSFRLADPVSGLGPDTSVVEILERATEWAGEDLQREPATQARILHTLGEIHAHLGRYDEASRLLERARDLRERLEGPRHASTLESIVALATLAMRLGELDRAEKLGRHVLAADADPPVAAAARRQLADVLGEKGAYDEAEVLAREALEVHRTAGPQMLHQVALDLNTLMEVQFKRGNLRAAAQTARRALDTSRRAFPTGSTAIADDIGNLGAAEWSLGRFAEAERLFTEALEMHRRRLGPDHPTVATDLNNLGHLRLEVQDAASAEPLFRDALDVLNRRFGDDHPRVAQAHRSLGTALMLALRLDEAERHFRESLRIHRLAANAVAVAEALNNLGTLHFLGDDPHAAEPLLQQALEIRRHHFGERGFRTGETLMMLARVDHRLGRLDSAERLYLDARESFRRSAGEEHWLVALTDLRRAELAVVRRDAAGGEKLTRGAMASLARGLAPDHWRVGEARSVLGTALAAQGQPEAAERELLGAYATLCAAWGAPSLPTREARRRLESLYESGRSRGRPGVRSVDDIACRRATL